jgi:hypothetical protein
VLHQSPQPPAAPLVVPVPIPIAFEARNAWKLLVAPARGWVPAWRDQMLAVVIIGAAAISALSGVLPRNRRRLIQMVQRLKVRRPRRARARARARGCMRARGRTRLACLALEYGQAAHAAPMRPLSRRPAHARPPQNTNQALAAEKERTDVLMARQLNLIACIFGGRGSGAAGGAVGSGVGSSGPSDSREGPRGAQVVSWEHAVRPRAPASPPKQKAAASLTTPPHPPLPSPGPTFVPPAEQIEMLRRTMQQAHATEADDHAEDIHLLELLGEGGFGKVYKGGLPARLHAGGCAAAGRSARARRSQRGSPRSPRR